jgi:uncharacterized protein (TIGR02118 family)
VIHQLIFAHPRPGMTEAEFQAYWVDVHAVRYASKIPQIRRYLVATRIPCGPEPADPEWSGCAEIWLRAEDQVASLQTPEFLEGARLDEPRWAAFWRTLVLDTDAHVVLDGPGERADTTMVKLYVLAKRREGMKLADARRFALDEHAPKVLDVPGLRRYVQGHVVDGAYGVGEAVLDFAFQLWFDDAAALETAMASLEWTHKVVPDLHTFVEARYVHTMAAREHWVLGPEERA